MRRAPRPLSAGGRSRPPTLLLIHRRVGAGHEGAGCAVEVSTDGHASDRDPDAGADGHRVGSELDGGADRVAEAVDERRRLAGVTDDKELVAAHPSHDVRGSHLVMKPVRHLDQDPVPGGVAVAVVHRFEPVEV